MPKKKEKKGKKQPDKGKNPTEGKNTPETKSNSLEVKTADSAKSTPDGSGNVSPETGSAKSSTNVTPNLTPYLQSKNLSDIRPVNEPTPASTPKLSTHQLSKQHLSNEQIGQFTNTPRRRPVDPFLFSAVQLTEEEKLKAAQLAVLKETEAKENEVRKRASAERYKQLSKDQAVQLASKEVKLDPKEYNRSKLKEQAAAEERRRSLLRDNIKQKSAKNSDLALKLVILIWVMIVAGIFWHVYSTIQVGRGNTSFRPGDHHFSSARSR